MLGVLLSSFDRRRGGCAFLRYVLLWLHPMISGDSSMLLLLLLLLLSHIELLSKI